MPKSSRIASRNIIDSEGNITRDATQAFGVQYIYHKTDGKVEVLFDELPEASQRAAWAFGMLTKIGNVVNTAVNSDKYDGADPVQDANEWLDDLKNGVWRERSVKGPRPSAKYDKTVIAAVLVAQLGPSAKGDAAYYLERLADRSYYAKVRSRPQIMAAYFERVGKDADATDSLA